MHEVCQSVHKIPTSEANESNTTYRNITTELRHVSEILEK
jgi:hypothetical protein